MIRHLSSLQGNLNRQTVVTPAMRRRPAKIAVRVSEGFPPRKEYCGLCKRIWTVDELNEVRHGMGQIMQCPTCGEATRCLDH